MNEYNDAPQEPTYTPKEVVDAFNVIIRWYREDKTGENWRVDVQQAESDRDGMLQLIDPSGGA